MITLPPAYAYVALHHLDTERALITARLNRLKEIEYHAGAITICLNRLKKIECDAAQRKTNGKCVS